MARSWLELAGAVAVCAAGACRSTTVGPVAHWPLATDARDATGHGHDGTSHGVLWDTPGSAGFDGRRSFIEVPDRADLRLGTGPFTLAAWVHTDAALDDALGDLASQFDPAARKGFTLSLLNYAGVTSGQPNWRNVHFGLDDARLTQPWTDCGRPGDGRMVWALCVWQDDLYAATLELQADQAGHVYRYAGGTAWEDCGSPDRANAVTTLSVFEGRLYAGTARYNATHSSLPPSLNAHPGGQVFCFDGSGRWTCCGPLENPLTGRADTVHSLAVWRGRLYASTMYAAGRGLYEYQGGTRWKYLGNPGCRVEALGVFNGHLYATSYDPPGRVHRYDLQGGWRDLGAPPGTDQTYAFMPYQGRLLLSTWPRATVWRLDEADRWVFEGRLGEELEAMAMAVYNGKLYAGSLPEARVYRHDGPATWTDVGRLDDTPDMRYRRVWSMAVFRGRLFAGTMPSGHVWSFEAGQNVTCDHEFPPGWHHLAAVRDRDHLRLYLDGRPVARSPRYGGPPLDVSNGCPLRIGLGSHDGFCGRLADVRLYRVALSDAQAAALAAARPADSRGPARR